MKSKNVKRVFDRFFKIPNPIFCVPVSYFKCGNYLCEVAMTKQMKDMKWNNYEFQIKSPLLILEALFVDSGMWVTVLEQKDRTFFVHRTDLCSHIDSKKALNSFINNLKSL